MCICNSQGDYNTEYLDISYTIVYVLLLVAGRTLEPFDASDLKPSSVQALSAIPHFYLIRLWVAFGKEDQKVVIDEEAHTCT